jgi:adenylate cyclase
LAFAPSYIWEVRGQTLYFLKRHEEAIAAFRNMSAAEHYWTPMFLAAALAQSGQLPGAQRELVRFLDAKPNSSLSSVSQLLGYATKSLSDYLLDGLRKAGLPE